MINKMKLFYTFLILSILSCARGLNYNVGRTHNADMANRTKIVKKQDSIMKGQMNKSRKRASRVVQPHRHARHSKRKFI